MYSFFGASIALLLGIASTVIGADNATKPAVSSLYISEIGTTIAINLPPNSTDLNFFITSQSWYSYFAIGIGSAMANALMLVVYSAADNQHITVSTRLGTGESEPPYYGGATITLQDGTSMQGDNYVVKATCKGCLSFPGGKLDTRSMSQSFIYAVGPNIPLASNDLSVGLRRHVGYGHFTMNMLQATGPGGIGVLTSVNPNVTTGASLVGGIRDDNNKASLAHGLAMVVVALVVAPVDMLAAGALRRWPVVHAITSLGYVAIVMAGFGIGIKISAQYLATQRFGTGHQALGFIAVVLLLILLAMGLVQCFQRRAVVRRGDDPRTTPKGPLFGMHVWGGRLLWIILLVNSGLGLALAQARQTFIIGFAVLAAGVFIAMILIQLCIFCCLRKSRNKREREEPQLYEFSQIYSK